VKEPLILLVRLLILTEDFIHKKNEQGCNYRNGHLSTIGYNLDEVTKSLYEGKSGIRLDPLRKNLALDQA